MNKAFSFTQVPITRSQILFIFNNLWFPMTTKCLLARDKATFVRRGQSINPTLLLRTHERMIMSFSAPWNASTVEIWIIFKSLWGRLMLASRKNVEILWTCERYCVITPTKLGSIPLLNILPNNFTVKYASLMLLKLPSFSHFSSPFFTSKKETVGNQSISGCLCWSATPLINTPL